jgi:hypothetical protein
MTKRELIARSALGALGGLVLLGAAGAAVAAEVSGDEVNVEVDIAAVAPVGALTMSVASGSTALTEVDSGDPRIRQFDGSLPAVTVTDDRGEVPEGVFWYVTGQSSSFRSADGGEISAAHLGWSPRILSEEGDAVVAAGADVGTVLDGGSDGVGLVGGEFLALAGDSVAAAGEWAATADLFLKTPSDVEPGRYSATITLTLWEDAL